MSLEVLIFNEFDRLRVSANQDAIDGLMTEAAGDDSPGLVRVHDGYSGGFYKDADLLEFLKGLEAEDTGLPSGSDRNIWKLIKEFEY
jgi:hypothetical protein